MSASPAAAASRSATARSSWSPQTIAATPALLVVVVLLVWSLSHGGFAVTTWYPGAICLVLVLAALVAGSRPRLGALPPFAQIALAALALFTAWSFASIIWADAKGVAWEGANRTLLYLVVFAIPALSRLDAPRALLVVGAWTAGIIVLAVWVLIELPGAVGPGRPVLGPGLAAPVGYANAAACLWLMAAWPALVLSSRAAVAPVLRGLFAGGALVLFDLSLLSESRGAVVAAAICLAVLLVVMPQRVRSLVGLVPVAVGAALTAPHVIDVSSRRRSLAEPIGDLASLAWPVLGAALVVAAVVTVLAVIERRQPVSLAARRAARRAIGAAAVVVVVAAVALLAGAGNPFDAVDDRWQSFKQGSTVGPDGTLVGFGGGRFDYYRVALDVIAEHPVVGVGADNFAQDYAARGRALEFPAYVHSVELRTVLHTGLVGALMLLIALDAALLAAWRASRRGLAASAAAVATVMVFAQWFVQGSADWFWEFPALGGAAFAMLGVACALAPGRGAVPPQADGPPPVDAPLPVDTLAPVDAPPPADTLPRAGTPLRAAAPRARRALGVAAVGLVVACCVSFGAPWASAILNERAGRVWTIDDAAAFRQLDTAADLNPLSARPALTEGTIALRLKRLDRARDAFERALERDPRDAYATVALGAIASQDDRPLALRYLRRAVRLNRQDGITIAALQTVRAGRPVDIPALLGQFALLARDARR